jgi:hypothetical protein
MRDMKVLVADLTLENRLLKKAWSRMGETRNEIARFRKTGDYPTG